MAAIKKLIDFFQLRQELLAKYAKGLAVMTVVILVLYSLIPALISNWRFDEMHDELKQEVETLQRNNERMEQEISALQTDPAYVEQVIRRRLHKVREGEYVLEQEKKDEANIEK